MLGASSDATGADADLDATLGSERGDGNMEHGARLTAFVEAAVSLDADAMERARGALVDAAGEAFMVDAAAVLANFEMMTRVADGTGARFPAARGEAVAPVADRLGLRAFQTAR